MKEAKNLSIGELNAIYERANSVDSELFSEQRSNILLSIGEHYSKKSSRFYDRVKDSANLTEDQKLRLTKNHIHRIVNVYVNSIFSLAPGVAITPKDKKSVQSQKTAELNDAVWRDWKQKNEYREQVRRDIDSFVKAGEVAGKVYFDPNGGRFLGYKQKVSEEGEPLFEDGGVQLDPMTGIPVPIQGPPIPDESKPVFSGKVCYEPIFTANLLREDTSTESVFEGILIYRKFVPTKKLESLYEGDEEKKKLISSGGDGVYMVFDGSSRGYSESKDQTLIREFYKPVSYECPNGYYWITTTAGILEQGEFPFGVHPIIFTGMDDVPTSPRKRSIIKVARPYQAEINRTGSKIAETQITYDTKLLTMAGSKVTQAAKMPGMRQVTYTGAQPVVVEGASGEQYLAYMNSQIQELYQAVNLGDIDADKATASTDSIAELFKIARHKKKFSLYAEKIEWYQVRKCEKVLELSKHYLEPHDLIPAIGKSEFVNIAEFKNSDPVGYRIALEPSNDDYETKFGKHLTFSTVLQYTGSKLERDDIGKILRVMPYTNEEEIFNDFTMEYDVSTNTILALDRGEYPAIVSGIDPKYIIKRLEKRRTEPDFQFLDAKIKENYQNQLLEYHTLEVANLRKIKLAQERFIPASGPLVKVDMYTESAEGEGSSRAKMPIDSLRWLKEQLEVQGIEFKELEHIQKNQVAEMADEFLSSMGNQGQPVPSRAYGGP